MLQCGSQSKSNGLAMRETSQAVVATLIQKESHNVENNTTRTSYVYAIKASNTQHLKIGFARNPQRRLKASLIAYLCRYDMFPTEEDLALAGSNWGATELAMHEYMAENRVPRKSKSFTSWKGGVTNE